MLYLKKGEKLQNIILTRRICKMIAMSYALSEKEVRDAFAKTNSIDIVLAAIHDSIINHTSIQQEISERQK